MLPFAFEDGMGFERYVDYALDVPMYFVYRDEQIYRRGRRLVPRFPRPASSAALPGERPTLDDWADHLTTLFPDVRLKRFLEMRGADAATFASSAALPALWVGLLYDGEALDRGLRPDLPIGLRQSAGVARRRAAARARDAVPRRHTARYRPRVVAIALADCAAGRGVDRNGEDERKALAPLIETVEGAARRRTACLPIIAGLGMATSTRCSIPRRFEIA